MTSKATALHPLLGFAALKADKTDRGSLAVYEKRWVIVDLDQNVIGHHQLPAKAHRIKVDLDGSSLTTGKFVVSAPELGGVVLDPDFVSEARQVVYRHKSKPVMVQLAAAEISQWFSVVLGMPVAVAYRAEKPEAVRPTAACGNDCTNVVKLRS